MQTVIKSTQLSLWNELPILPANISSRLSFTESKNDEMEVTAHTVRLLPTSAGDGKPSIKSITKKTGDELKVAAADASRELKNYLVNVAQETLKSNDIGGQRLRITDRSLTVVFKRLNTVKFMTDQELAAQLGITIAEVTAIRKAGKASQVELKPTPQNGTPELMPAGDTGTTPEAPVANPETPAPRQRRGAAAKAAAAVAAAAK
jgi:hypothetical protein